MEKFRLTKDGKVIYDDKTFKHMNHRINYIAKKEREGYEVESMEDYNARECENTKAYVQAQEEALFERFVYGGAYGL
jgi:hypothetical protein